MSEIETQETSSSKTLTREELYDRVWQTPMQHLCKEFGLSGPGLAKLCQRHGIPTPPRGYWEMLRHGKSPSRPELPDETGTSSEIVISPSEQRPLVVLPESPKPEVPVQAVLRSVHPLLSDLVKAKPDKNLNDKGVFRRPYGAKGLSFPVGPDLFSRALRIADALFRAFDERGWGIREPERRYGPSEFDVTVGEQRIAVRLRERLKMLRNPKNEYPHTTYEPGGILELIIDCWAYKGRKTFVDGTRRGLLENQLGDVVAALQAAAEADRADDERREQERILEEEAQRRRWEQEAERQKEAERARVLEEQAIQWSRARLVSDYIAAVRFSLPKLGDPRVESWLRWGEAYAARLCPVRSGLFGPAPEEASS